MEFEQLDLKHQAVFEKYKHRGNPLSSVQNFTALYMWKDALGFEIFDAGDILYMRRTQPPVCGFLPPLTLRDEDIPKAIETIRQYARDNDYPPQIIDAEEWLLEQLSAHGVAFEAEEDRDNAEYIYSGEKLRTLSGKKMHRKKNHYNHFVKNQNYEVRPLAGNAKAALAMAHRWLQGKEYAYTIGELQGIALIFENLDSLPLKGLTVFVDGVCQGFTISEDVGENDVLVHVEKASDEIPGLFTFVNSENQRINHPNADLVNREQDLGLEGLRKAKLSWRPVDMINKFMVRF